MGTKAGPACLGRCPSGYSGRTRRFIGKDLAGCWDPTGYTLRATAGYLATRIRGLLRGLLRGLRVLCVVVNAQVPP